MQEREGRCSLRFLPYQVEQGRVPPTKVVEGKARRNQRRRFKKGVRIQKQLMDVRKELETLKACQEATEAQENGARVEATMKSLQERIAALEKESEDRLLNENCQGPSGKFFDNHFHYDRMRKWKLRLDDDDAAALEGEFVVYCDPQTFPSIETIEELKESPMRLLVAVGIHPEHASKHPVFLAKAINKIGMLKEANQLHAVGEMGSDTSKPIPLVTQEKLLQQLPLVAPRPMILHIRGRSKDESGDFIYNHYLYMLIGKLDQNQKIQLHSFSGSSSTV